MIVKGSLLPGHPDVEGGPVDLLLAAEQRDPDRALLRWVEGSWTVAEFADRARRWGTVIDDLGVRPGDRLALFSRNRADLLALQYGIYMRGVVELAVNAELRGGLLANVLQDGAPALVIAEPELCDAAAAQLPRGVRLVPLDDALLRQVAIAAPCEPRTVSPTELALILHTSGTTGPSKGVMLSHAYLAQQGATWTMALDNLGPDDVSYFVLPFFHIDAHSVLVACLLSGATFGFAARFSVTRFWTEAAALGATWFLGVGSMAAALVARQPPKQPKHSFRVLAFSPVPEEAYGYFEDELGVPVVQLYGQTEANLVMFTTPERNPHGSCGYALAGLDVAVVDEHDRPLPAGQLGQLVYRPTLLHQTTMGYWNRPDATAASMRNLWWHSGDLAVLDDNGAMYFRGRLTDSLRHRGENISAYEVEQILADAPGVQRAIAVAVTDELGNEDEIKLYVVLDESAPWDPADFFAYCDEALPRYATPRFVEPIDEERLVLSPGNGSVQKHRLPREHGPSVVDREAL